MQESVYQWLREWCIVSPGRHMHPVATTSDDLETAHEYETQDCSLRYLLTWQLVSLLQCAIEA
jgi:hypothetical protein